MDGAPVLVEAADEGLDAAFEVVVDLFAVALIKQAEPDALGQVGVVAKPLGFDAEVEVDVLKDGFVEAEGKLDDLLANCAEMRRRWEGKLED